MWGFVDLWSVDRVQKWFVDRVQKWRNSCLLTAGPRAGFLSGPSDNEYDDNSRRKFTIVMIFRLWEGELVIQIFQAKLRIGRKMFIFCGNNSLCCASNTTVSETNQI